jgi:acid phosphatase family membrane protein YuiD
MYDARGIRATVGKHAKLLNTFSKSFKLEESVGHTNWEVIVGSSLGIILTILVIKAFGI